MNPTVSTSDTDSIVLENEHVRYDFVRATGCLVDITDKATGRSHLTRRDGARLFRVVCPSEKWATRYADAQDCDPPEIDQRDGSLRMHYPRLNTRTGPLDIAVTVHVNLPPDDSEARFQMELVNGSDGLVHEVRFPWVAGWESYGGRGKDRALAGCRPLDPHPPEDRTLYFNIAGANRRSFHGMEIVMLPFFDLSGPDAGLSYICYHQSPILGGFVADNLDDGPTGNNYGFAWTSATFTEPGGTWKSQEIGISPHRGNWRATADRYRAFLDGWWQAPPRPKRLSSAIGFQVVMVRAFTGEPLHRFRDIPRMAEAGLKYGVEDLSLWDPIAALYARPDNGDFWEQYDPDEPLDELRASLSEAADKGVNTSTLVNYRLMRRNSPVYREKGDEMVQRGLHGTPLPEDWSHFSDHHASLETKYLSRMSLALCQRSPGFRKMAAETTDHTMALGFTSLFIDQTFDLNPCFGKDHGHLSPADTPEAVIEWVSKAAAGIRDANPEAYVVGENLDVFVSQHINVNWVWMWSVLAPEVMRYVLPDSVMCWIVDRQPGNLNRAFAHDSFMALTTKELTSTLDEYPEMGEHVKRLADLRKRTAPYVCEGRFRHTIGLNAGDATAFVYVSDAGLAVVLAEVSGDRLGIGVELDAAAHGMKVVDEGTLYRSDGSEEAAGWRMESGHLRLDCELPPFGVAVWHLPVA